MAKNLLPIWQKKIPKYLLEEIDRDSNQTTLAALLWGAIIIVGVLLAGIPIFHLLIVALL